MIRGKCDNLWLIDLYDEDVFRIMAAIESIRWKTAVQVTGDGWSACDRLRHPHEEDRASRPDLILLEIDVPGGRDFLATVRSETCTLRRVPVLVLTRSHDPEDVMESYRIGATAYILKPDALEEYVPMMKRIHTYWCDPAVVRA